MIWQQALSLGKDLLKAIRDLTVELEKINARYDATGKELDS